MFNKKVLEFIDKYHLLPKHSKLLVGVSGEVGFARIASFS